MSEVEQVEVKEVTEVKKQVATIETNENGVINPRSIEEAYRYASAVHKSGLAPKQFDSPEKVLVAMQTAKELNLPALTSLKNMYVINGSVALFGDLPLALVRRSGLLEDFKEIQYNKEGKEISKENGNLNDECFSSTCMVKRKGEDPVTRSFTWEEVLKAGLEKNKWGLKETYQNFRKRMLQMRARSWSLKDVFSDVLLGIAIFEYDDFNSDEKDVSPVDSLNERLGLKK